MKKNAIKILTISEYERLKPKYNIYVGKEEPSMSLGSFGDLFAIYREPGDVEPYNEALAIAGVNVEVDSLNDVLNNATYCKKIAASPAATKIMKTNYAAVMNSYIDTNFNSGLNQLNFTCGLKCAVFNRGVFLDGVTFVRGAYYGVDTNNKNVQVTAGSDYYLINASAGSSKGANGWMQTSVKIDLTPFDKITSYMKYGGLSSTYNILQFAYGDAFTVGQNGDVWNQGYGGDVANKYQSTGDATITSTLDCSTVSASKLIGYFDSIATASSGYIYVYDLWLHPSAASLADLDFNDALEVIGEASVNSLDEILSNSALCSKIAGSTTAANIMKLKYKAEMTAAIDASWNDGLNTLNAKCGFTYYLFYPGHGVTSAAGTFSVSQCYAGTAPKQNSITANSIIVQSGANEEGSPTGSGVLLGTNNAISFNGYDTLLITSGAENCDIQRFVMSTSHSWSTLRTTDNLIAAIHWSASNLEKYCQLVSGVGGSGDKTWDISSMNSSYYMTWFTSNSKIMNMTKIKLIAS